MKKRLLGCAALLMTAVICFAGCAGKEDTGKDEPADQNVTQALGGEDAAGDAADKNATSDTAQTSEGSGDTASSDADVSDPLGLKGMDAVTLQYYLGNGINLGNTMEAYGHTTLGTMAAVSSYETCWGQPITTAEIVKGMKECGFDTLRIPVAWTNMMAFEAGNYTIAPEYLDRVEEIVNYALDADMFVIVNDHWDGGWWARFGSATPETVDAAFEQYTSMWSQIAERFKDYSYRLIFESANEELGDSLNNNSYCADSGKLTKDECYEMTTKINQRFIDTVRASGGNNADRFLLIAGYNTDIDLTVDSRYVMPVDTVSGKLLISVHYYTPWNYCGTNNQARWGLKNEYEMMDTLLAKMTRFTDAGYGVIIGEYGALPVYDSDTGAYTLKENTVEYTEHFLDNCDVYGYCPVLWSCNDFYNRRAQEMISPEVAELFAGRSFEKESAAGDAYLAGVKSRLETSAAEAIEMWNDVETYEAGTPVAWIMWNGGAGTYSVGDTFNPADNTAGITANNIVVDGAGEYTVSLDFAGGNDGLTFGALAIADAELLYPNCVIIIEKICYDGEEVELIADPYTTSDDGKCTRVNLINEWVTEIPAGSRSLGSLKSASPVILDKTKITGIHNISITFRLVVR